MSRVSADYDREAAWHARNKAKCPEACAMWDRLFAANDKFISMWGEPNHRLEIHLVGLGVSIDHGREIGEQEIAFYEGLLGEVAG